MHPADPPPLPQAAFTPAAMTATQGAHPPGVSGAGAPPRGERESLGGQLRRAGLALGPTGERFRIEDLLGAGAGGRVYAAQDLDLERPVAIKVMSAEGAPSTAEVEAFVAEARITASLDHPNVVPVHEIEMNAERQLFFTMKRIVGRSLGAVIEGSSESLRLAPLDDVNAVVTLFIGVTQAIALAHSRAIVHQDIKPDNILLGDFGEVLVCDWGSALRLDDGTPHKLYGSPLYMSPEQARNDRVDRRSDVYCIGASLFHALLLRPPSWEADSDAFWASKRLGRIQEPTPAERSRLPSPLLAIALKALAAAPERRYADAGLLLADLRAFQAGLSVVAVPESWFTRLRRWQRRHARVLWGWSAAAALVLVVVGLLWGERLEEMARWGSPLTTLDPTHADWATQWTAIDGSFAAVGAAVVSTGMKRSTLVLNRHLSGAMAIEYDGEIPAGSPPCDISAVWARDVTTAADGHITGLVDPYNFQVGAMDDNYTVLGDSHGNPLACDPFHPQVGRIYHIRDEVVDDRLTLSVDGRVLCQWQEPFPLASGYLAIDAYYPGKRFSNVRVYQRQPPAKVPATAIGDASAIAGSWTLAASQYDLVAMTHPHTALGEEARYKQGLCEWHEGRWEKAESLWQGLPGPTWGRLIQVNRIEHAIDQRAYTEAMRQLEVLASAPQPTPEMSHRTALLWGHCAEQVGLGTDSPQLHVLWDMYLRHFTGQTVVDGVASNMLLALDWPQQILDRFPGQHYYCCQALGRMKRLEELVDRYPDQASLCSFTAFQIGRWDRIDRQVMGNLWEEAQWLGGHAEREIDNPDAHVEMRANALLSVGRLQEVAEDPRLETITRAHALVMMDRPGLAVERFQGSGILVPLMMLGRYDEVRALGAGDLATTDELNIQLGMHALMDGNLASARHLLAQVPTGDTRVNRAMHCDELLLVPWVDDLIGLTQGELDRTSAIFCTYPNSHARLMNGALFLQGTITAQDFLGQRCAYIAPSRLLLYQAILAQRRGDAAAEAGYERAWMALPRYLRSQSGFSAVDLIMQWRLQVLARAGSPSSTAAPSATQAPLAVPGPGLAPAPRPSPAP